MNKINLDEGKIFHEGKWRSVEDLSRMIQEKMRSGDMKISGLADALEELNTALENSHTISVSMMLTKDDYDRLKASGKVDDRECIRKAIQEFIKEGVLKKPVKKRAGVRCASCNFLINLDMGRGKNEIECPECGARGVLKPAARNK